MRCLIVSGGDLCQMPDSEEYDYIIACDRGIEYAHRLGLRPNLLLGDLDSLDEAIPGDYTDIELLTFPKVKDDTDTMLAIREALNRGYTDVTLTCALGGRLDHTYANLQGLAYIAAHSGVGRLQSEDEYVQTFTGGRLILPRREGFALSLMAYSDHVTGLSIQGTGYEASDIELTNTFPLGVSNEWAADEAVISMDQGLLLIIESRL